ncbi:hypothetical protein [Cellulomonas composti]|uniref:hypothetical protein n=1 Tax=Cellulomonas composti TaxID=266130 RepID=UPI0011BFC974|nr:hypothetical protein [Cellulomonas composti]
MRWEALFEDLEGRLAAARDDQVRDEVADLVRAERAQVRLADRWRGARGATLRLVLVDGQVVEGVVVDSAAQWVLLAEPGRRQALVPAGAIAAVVGAPPHAAAPGGEVDRSLTLGHTLRALTRDRVTVLLDVRGSRLRGRLERVGADHVDLSPLDVVRDAAPWSVPFDAILVVRSG